MKGLRIILQVLLLILISMAGDFISAAFHLKIPGSILGLVLLFVLLTLKIVKLSWVELGASWLLAELLLFFIPSAVGIIQYKTLMVDDGYKMVLVITLSLIVVMVAGGTISEFIINHHKSRRDSVS